MSAIDVSTSSSATTEPAPSSSPVAAASVEQPNDSRAVEEAMSSSQHPSSAAATTAAADSSNNNSNAIDSINPSSSASSVPPIPSPSSLYFERQRWCLCGLHCLNNLLQHARYCQRDFDAICKQLSPTSFINPHRSIFGIGQYDVNVLMAALQAEGLDVHWHDSRRRVNDSTFEGLYGLIMNVPSTSFQLWKSQHWVCLKRINHQHMSSQPVSAPANAAAAAATAAAPTASDTASTAATDSSTPTAASTSTATAASSWWLFDSKDTTPRHIVDVSAFVQRALDKYGK